MAIIKGIPVRIAGTGKYIPEKVMTNADFEKIMETSDEWIRERTGIKERHFAAEGENCCDLAAKAALAALDDVGMAPGEIDAVIVSTNSPETLCPCSAATVQGTIGAAKAGAFDVISGCTGSLTAMLSAISCISCGVWENALVIGAESFGSVIDWTDRNSAILFGDGAGACVLSRSTAGGGRFISGEITADGTKHDLITIGGGGNPAKLRMKGQEVFRFVNAALPPFIKNFCKESGTDPRDIDFWVLHQANIRITESLFRRLGVPQGRTLANLEKYGNTSAASLMINLDEAMKAGYIKAGEKIAFAAFGAGMTLGALLYSA